MKLIEGIKLINVLIEGIVTMVKEGKC